MESNSGLFQLLANLLNAVRIARIMGDRYAEPDWRVSNDSSVEGYAKQAIIFTLVEYLKEYEWKQHDYDRVVEIFIAVWTDSGEADAEKVQASLCNVMAQVAFEKED